MYTNYYWLWPEVIPKDVCDLIIKRIPWEKSEQGSVQKNTKFIVDKKKRITDVFWENPLSVVGCIAQSYIGQANSLASWNFVINGLEDVQIGRYTEKGHYDWHKDAMHPVNGQQRKLSLSLLLNDPSEFEGGTLEIKNVKKQPEMKLGSICVFPSTLEHRITSIKTGVRYSAVAWAQGPAFI